MTISLKHKFTSPKSDGADSTLVKPSNWNDEHDITMATNKLLGRSTAGAGVVEEISVSTGLTLSSGALSVSTNTYQPIDTELTALAGLTSASDRLPYFTGVGTAALATFTSAGRALVDDADAAAQRTTLGLGTASTLNVGTSANNVVQLDGSAKLPAVDGSQLTNISTTGRLLREPQYLTSGTSYTTPSGCTRIFVEAVGGGGGGGGAKNNNGGNTSYSGGGGGGGYTAKWFTVTASTAYTYAIGAGGTAGAATPTSGTAGGNTTFTVGGTTITANGGNGGGGITNTSATSAGTTNAAAPGLGGTASGGDVNVRGGAGVSQLSYNTSGTPSGNSMGGGSSMFGVGGLNNAAAGTNGGGGAGDNGTTSGAAGGAGGNGMIRVWEYAF